MAGPWDAHQGVAQETEERFPTTPELPPPAFENKLMWVVLAVVAVGVIAVVLTWVIH